MPNLKFNLIFPAIYVPPKRVTDYPANLYHSNISLEMIILPFFHYNFFHSLYFFNNWRLHPRYYDYFDKLIRLENVELFSRKDKILDTIVYKYCIDYCLKY